MALTSLTFFTDLPFFLKWNGGEKQSTIDTENIKYYCTERKKNAANHPHPLPPLSQSTTALAAEDLLRRTHCLFRKKQFIQDLIPDQVPIRILNLPRKKVNPSPSLRSYPLSLSLSGSQTNYEQSTVGQIFLSLIQESLVTHESAESTLQQILL